MLKVRIIFLVIILLTQFVKSGAQIEDIIIANWEDKVPITAPGPDVWQYFTPNGASEIIPNPVPDEINSSPNVLAYYRPAGEWLLTGFFYMDGIRITRNITGIEFKIYGDSLFKCYAKLAGTVDGIPDQTIFESSWPWTAPDGSNKWNIITLPIYGDTFLNDTLTTILIFPVNATNQNFAWMSSNPNVATVSSIGKVHALNPGAADIIVTSEDGNKTDTCHIIVNDATGMNKIHSEALNIYPNPFHGGELTIFLPHAYENDINLTIIDLQGRILMNYLINKPGNAIKISPQLKNGTYIIKIISGDNAWYERIIQY